MTESANARYVRESRARRKAEGYVRIEVQVPERDVARIRKMAQHMRAEYEMNRNKEKTDG